MPCELRGTRRRVRLARFERPVALRCHQGFKLLVRQPWLVYAERIRENGEQSAYIDRAEPSGGAPVAPLEDHLNVVGVEAVRVLFLDERSSHGRGHEADHLA